MRCDHPTSQHSSRHSPDFETMRKRSDTCLVSDCVKSHRRLLIADEATMPCKRTLWK